MPDRVSDSLPARRPPRPVLASAFLSVGAPFTGLQMVPTADFAPSNTQDQWRVNITVQGVSFERGTICGSMEALDVPGCLSPVRTLFHGYIIDNRNYSFTTGAWRARFEDDVEHWSEFRAFEPLIQAAASGRADNVDLSTSRYVFMRWK